MSHREQSQSRRRMHDAVQDPQTRVLIERDGKQAEVFVL